MKLIIKPKHRSIDELEHYINGLCYSVDAIIGEVYAYKRSVFSESKPKKKEDK